MTRVLRLIGLAQIAMAPPSPALAQLNLRRPNCMRDEAGLTTYPEPPRGEDLVERAGCRGGRITSRSTIRAADHVRITTRERERPPGISSRGGDDQARVSAGWVKSPRWRQLR